MSSLGLRALLLASVFTLPAGTVLAASFTVPAGTTNNSPQTLTGSETGTIAATGTLSTGGVAVTIDGVDTGVILTNSGTLTSTGNRAVEISGANTDRTITITNNAGGVMSSGANDVLRLSVVPTGGAITVDNAGLIQNTGGAGQGIDFRTDTGGAAATKINNLATGVIWSTTDDAVRPNQGAVLTNAGTIKSTTASTAYGNFDGVDWGANTGKVVNQATGVISGVRHGITADLDVDVTNQAGGVIIGNNGSGVGSDGTGRVVNYGTITGAATSTYNPLPVGGDGDGVDIDGLATIENYGVIEGAGAYGVDGGGRPNASEGLAAGGGTINNYAGATIRGVNSGILIDNGAAGPAIGGTVLSNAGTISGLAGAGVNIVGGFADTITNTGVISAVGGVAVGVGGGFDQVTNSGTITTTGSVAIDLGNGDDTLTLLAGGTINGLVNGGDDRDEVELLANGAVTTGTFAGGINLERLTVREGSWTLTGSQDYALGAVLRNKTAITVNANLTATQTVAINLPTGSVDGVTITNNAIISTTQNDGRAIDITGLDNTRNLTINNNAGATISSQNDAIHLDVTPTGGVILINNAGVIRTTAGVGSNGGQAIDFDNAAGAVSIQINNLAGGQILSVGQDAVRPGQGAQVVNAGTIRSDLNPAIGFDNLDGIDWQNRSGTVVNQATGTISGARDGVTGNADVTVTNLAGGTITGRNGAGISSDANGVVVNRGTITGAADQTLNPLPLGGDGDGLDIDGLASIDNYGVIQGTGAYGTDNGGRAHASEGIALGGGTITNRAGALISGANNGIRDDNGFGGPAIGATVVTNDGTIRGLNGAGISLVGAFNNVVTNTGTISAVGGVAISSGAGADTIVNSGTISSTGATAISLGGGNDSLTLKSGSVITGQVDGAAGTDAVVLQSNGAVTAGSFATSINFETLDVQSGIWTLTGPQTYSSGSTVRSGATLVANASLGGVLDVLAGGRLKGSGTVGSVTVAGTVAPGNSIGTLNVGSITFGPGSVYEVEVDAAASDLIAATGTASLAGSVRVQPASGATYAPVNEYTILTAAGGRSGTFSGVSSDLAFLAPELSYTATQVRLTLRRNNIQFGDVATTANQRRVGAAVTAAGFASPLYQALLPLAAGPANAILDEVSGDLHPSLPAALRQEAQDARGAMLGRATGEDSGPWVRVVDRTGRVDAEGGRARADQHRIGLMGGFDYSQDNWRLGGEGGFSNGRLELPDRGSTADIGGLQAAGYGAYRMGNIRFSGGLGLSRHRLDTTRILAGLGQTLVSSYDANIGQAFAEASVQAGAISPFAGFAFTRVKFDRFSESGGSAALEGAGRSESLNVSTLGLRYQGNAGPALLHAEAAWRHSFDTSSSQRLTIIGAGQSFIVDGAADEADIGQFKLGTVIRLSPGAVFTLDGDLQLAGGFRQYGASGSFHLRF